MIDFACIVVLSIYFFEHMDFIKVYQLFIVVFVKLDYVTFNS